MSITDLTVVYFDCGNYSEEEGKLVWKKNGKLWTLVMKTTINDVSYLQMVNGIASKIGIDEATTKLKLSYIPFLFDYEAPIDIVEDDDVLGYLTSYKDQCRSVLHVEVVKNDWDEVGESSPEEVKNVEREEVDAEREEVKNVEREEVDVEREEVNDDVFDCPDYPALESGELVCAPTTERGVFVSQAGEWADGIEIEIHKEFEQKQVLFDIVHKASNINCFEFLVNKSDSKRLVLKCRDWKNGCKWGLRAAVLKNASCFSLRKHNKMHSCLRSSTTTSTRRRRGTARLIAGMLNERYEDRFDTPAPKTLVGMAQKNIGVKVSYTTAWRGRKLAASYVRGSPLRSYGMIYSYFYMLQKLNPGTEAFVQLDDQHRLKYLFFALGQCIEGFQWMRKVLIIDAAHLKGGQGGVLCVVTAQDGNRHNYPVGFGLIDG